MTVLAEIKRDLRSRPERRAPICLTVLGFDYGTRRIGVAAGQTVTATASPLGTIPVWHSQPDWDSINAMIRSWRPDALVVGMPTTTDGTEHRLATAIEHFVRQLRGRYRLPVYTIDEHLSSYEAQRRIPGANRGAIDAVAAQVILETWLSRQVALCHERGHWT
jgi:putative holliday junction resolvase